MQMLSRKKMAGIALWTSALAVVAAPLGAQETPSLDARCTVQLSPASVAAGSAAVQVTAILSEDVGTVTGLDATEGGIAIARASDLPRTDMAANTQPRPIEMAAEGNQWTIWLNTTEAEAGTHPVVFTGERGECVGELTVN